MHVNPKYILSSKHIIILNSMLMNLFLI